MRSSDFKHIVEPHGVDTTRMQVIKRGAAQSNKILSDFKKGKPAEFCNGGRVRKGY